MEQNYPFNSPLLRARRLLLGLVGVSFLVLSNLFLVGSRLYAKDRLLEKGSGNDTRNETTGDEIGVDFLKARGEREREFNGQFQGVEIV